MAFIIVLLVLLAGIGGGAWALIAQPWATPAATPTQTQKPTSTATTDVETPSPTASASETPAPTETPGIVACEAEDVDVVAVTDAGAYAAGVLPKLSIQLTNKGERDCTMNVGSSTQKFTVTSGSDVWWRSTDCQTEPSDMIVTLEAGKSVTSASPVVWDRTRSSVNSCEEKNRPRAPGGGASYHVAVSIGGFESASSKQIILR